MATVWVENTGLEGLTTKLNPPTKYQRGITFSDFLFWELLVIVIALGFVASIWTGPGTTSEWYQNLSQAPWNPPSWVYTLIWTVLYILIGLTAYTGIKSDPRIYVFGLLFIIGMILNVLWAFIFFAVQSIIGGFVILMILDLVVLAQCIYLLCQTNRPAKITGGLLFIYLIWLVYATSLNGYLLNQ
jgi:tryptophan-rich sensory protein